MSFNGFQLFDYNAVPPQKDGATPEPPGFVLELTPWWEVFLSNLRDFVSPKRLPAAAIPSIQGDFLADVFIDQKVPWAAIRQSVLCHAFVIVVIVGLSQSPLLKPRTVEPKSPFDNTTITYYSVSEYLPPLEMKAEPAKESRRGDPEYAKQEIISIPRSADNTRQTIVAPPQVRIDKDVSLPNILSWEPDRVPLPAEAVRANLRAPRIGELPVVPPSPTVQAALNLPRVGDVSPVQPTVTGEAKLTLPAELMRHTVVPPSPEVGGSLTKLPNVPLPSALQPSLAADAVRRRPGELNVGQMQGAIADPVLPVPEQQAISSHALAQAASRGRSVAPLVAGGQPVPPPVEASGGTGSSQGVGQFVALNLRPAPVTGPIDIPHGNRQGAFAATPIGRPGASGTPDIHGDGKSNGPGGRAMPGEATGPSLRIGPGDGPSELSKSGVVVSGPTPPSTPAKPSAPLFASLKRPSVEDLARQSQPISAGPRDDVEKSVFGVKKYYSMMLNMPNLTSAGGSWVIRFAELHEASRTGELTAPVAIAKVDPAYPTELIRDRVEGTVTLYAIIRADGSVSEVRVLRSVDSRLDENARIALSKWRFRPGTRNGAAVDLEAVVQIPFIAKRPGF